MTDLLEPETEVAPIETEEQPLPFPTLYGGTVDRSQVVTIPYTGFRNWPKTRRR